VNDLKGWDNYWSQKRTASGVLYDFIAGIYRRCLIKPILSFFVNRHFSPGSKILHAGCGSGQVDKDIHGRIFITAMDLSMPALRIYQETNGELSRVVNGDIFKIPFGDGSFDGVYNLGVMEHFFEDEIQSILMEFHRVLKPNGKIILFWPPEFGASVIFLKGIHFIFDKIFRKKLKLYPDEVTRIKSRKHIEGIIKRTQLEFSDYYFGIRDMFTQAVVILRKA
jgi:SAM-dependent methyltransferase